MSTRYPGGLISSVAPVPTGGGAQDSAPGIWTIDQADQYIATQTWPGTGTPDPQFEYVTALLHGDGTNGGQNNTFLDSSSNNFTITRNGNTTQGSFSPYGDLWSNYFGGTNQFLSIADNTAFNFGTGDATVEFWFNSPGTSNNFPGIISSVNFGVSGSASIRYDNTGYKGKVFMYVNGGGDPVIASATTIPYNTWAHVAIVRQGTSFRLYLNGNLDATATISGSLGWYLSASGMRIGRGFDVDGGAAYYIGNISNIRLVKGTAVYTSNFTPSTTPLTVISGTSLLTCADNRFIDDSSNNFTITPNGSPSVQRFSPFQNLATYTPARVGGSGYFDGSGDYLTGPSNSAFAFGTGDFTIELWLYPTSFSGTYQTYVSTRTGTGSGADIQLFNGTQLMLGNDSGAIVSASNVLTLSTWNHIVVSRSGSTNRLYVNGTLVATATNSNNFTSTGCYISSGQGGGNNPAIGYITDVRIVKGTALYTGSTYTIPTAPLAAITNTSLLTNFTNGAIFDSDATNVLETVGNAQISTSVVKYGTGSMAFDGSGDWLQAPNTPNLALGSGNFTIECWINFNSLATNRGILYFGTNPNTNFSYGLQWAGNVLYFWYTTNGSNLASVSAAWTPSTGIWYHLAVSRAGNSLFFFINGAQIGTTQSMSGVTIFNSTDVIRIGGEATGSPNSLPGVMNGYIDEFRVTKGYARYWYNFQPPTAPFPNYGGVLAPPVQDPLFDFNTLLLNGDGTNGAQNNTFLDSSTNNFSITRNGNTTQGSFSPYGDLWSNFFNGSSYLQIASSSAFNMNTFCSFETWVNISTLTSSRLIIGRESSYWLGYDFTGIAGAANKFVFSIYNGSSWQAVSSSTSPVAGTWYHVVGVKDNTTLRIYINGTQENTATFSGTPQTGADTFFIASNANTQNLTGYVSNARLNLGTTSAVLPYTANFTPSTVPLTAVTGTQLLTCQSNRFRDASTNNFVPTINGTPSVQRFSPFNPTAPYSTSVIGGSGYFDGSGDYLSAADNAALQMGSGDFTVEAWVYSTATNAGASIVDKWTSGSNTDSGFLLAMDGSGRLRGIYGSGGSEFIIDSSSTVPQNAWTHVAIVRSGGTFYLYQNGVSVNSRSITGSVNNGQAFGIGARASSSGTQPWLGYISQARVVKGTAVYSGSTYTVPTAPLTAISGTSILANMTNAGIPDLAMQNNLETVGNAQVSTSVVKYGTGSLAFDGTGDYLTTRSTAVGTINYTVEYWIYPTSSADLQGVFVTSLSAVTGNLRIGIYLGKLYVDIYDGTGSINAGAAIALNTWTHVAVTKQGSTYRSFLNGNLNTTWTDSTTITGTDWTIGRLQSDGYDFAGYIDDLRVTRGIARYVQPFTPPTQALQTF